MAKIEATRATEKASAVRRRAMSPKQDEAGALRRANGWSFRHIWRPHGCESELGGGQQYWLRAELAVESQATQRPSNYLVRTTLFLWGWPVQVVTHFQVCGVRGWNPRRRPLPLGWTFGSSAKRRRVSSHDPLLCVCWIGTTFLNCLTGSELLFYDLAVGLQRRGHEVTAWVKELNCDAPLPRLLDACGIPISEGTTG